MFVLTRILISVSISLVLKYRKGDEDSLMEKISKLNFHSIIKKSNRVSSHLKHLTGFAPQVLCISCTYTLQCFSRSICYPSTPLPLSSSDPGQQGRVSLGSEPPISAVQLGGRRAPHLVVWEGLSPALPPLKHFLSQLKDEAFEETEKNFRMQERLIKSFIRDLSLYLQHVRVSQSGCDARPVGLTMHCPSCLHGVSLQ